jgi:hypothetical protein
VSGSYHSAAQIQAITWVSYRRIHKGLVWRIVTGHRQHPRVPHPIL